MLALFPPACKQQVAKNAEEHGYAGYPKPHDLF